MSAKRITFERFELIVQALAENRVVIMPCDTIYGLVGAAPETESKLIELKKRREKRFLRLIPDADISPYSPDSRCRHFSVFARPFAGESESVLAGAADSHCSGF